MVDRRGRRSIRLPGFDYTQAGGYFVTICTYMRHDLFGIVTDGEMLHSQAGRIAARCWKRVPSLFTNITLDAWVVMPNHVHAIIVLGIPRRGEALEHLGTPVPRVPTPSASPLPSSARGTEPGSLGAIIQNYKSVCARRINQLRHSPGQPVWQWNYYEHVLRDENDLERVRNYVFGNPLPWRLDAHDPGEDPF